MYRTTLPAIIPPFILVELDLVIYGSAPKESLIEVPILDISTHFALMSLINYEVKTLSVVLYNKTNNIECKSLIIVDIKSLALVKITVMQQMLVSQSTDPAAGSLSILRTILLIYYVYTNLEGIVENAISESNMCAGIPAIV